MSLSSEKLEQCKATVGTDLDKLKKTSKAFTNPWYFIFHVDHDLIINGQDVNHELMDAMAQWENQHYYEFGHSLGLALSKIFLGQQMNGIPMAHGLHGYDVALHQGYDHGMEHGYHQDYYGHDAHLDYTHGPEAYHAPEYGYEGHFTPEIARHVIDHQHDHAMHSYHDLPHSIYHVPPEVTAHEHAHDYGHYYDHGYAHGDLAHHDYSHGYGYDHGMEHGPDYSL